MSTKKKMLEAAAGAAGGEATYVEDVFSTYLYTGNGSTQTITNGIDLDGEGGLVWAMCRTNNNDHYLFDTERPYDDPPTAWYEINSNNTNAQAVNNGILSMNSDGYSMRFNNDINASGEDYVSWTFRKAPGFFDIVTWTGNATIREISHNLGCVPGMIIVKVLSVANPWAVYHKGVDSTAPEDFFLSLNRTDSKVNSAGYWNDTAPTATEFTIGATSDVNASGQTYVAYLFADGDDAAAQIFGTNGDQAIVKCGSFTDNGSLVDLGFEPQWVLIKRTDSTSDWRVIDNIRGMCNARQDAQLLANTSDLETSALVVNPFSNGFSTGGYLGGGNYIYIAIRRGPMKTPESATEVFSPVAYTANNTDNRLITTGILTDAVFARVRNTTSTSGGFQVGDRLRNIAIVATETTAAETFDADSFMTPTVGYGNAFSTMDGFGVGNDSVKKLNYSTYSQIAYAFKRAPGFFDVVCYTGDGVAGRTVDHNLGVAPEMMIVKQRNGSSNWGVYHKDLTADYIAILEMNLQALASTAWDNTEPTESVFSLYSTTWVNGSGNTFIAYLFASQAGISKVGSYTGNGTSQNIDCGFSAGARFVLIKRTDSTGDWHVWDTERGIVSGNDPFLELNTTNAENSSYDSVDPDSSGFVVNQDAGTNINVSSATYIYLAIA